MKNIGKNSAVKIKASSWLNFDFVIGLVLLVIIFLVPIIFDRRLGIVFSGTKVAWLRALTVFTLALWAGKGAIFGHSFRRTPLDWPILSFLLLTTAATILSVHPYTSFSGFYGRFEGLTTWYVFGALFFLIVNFIKDQPAVRRVMTAAVASGTVMSVYSIVQRQEIDPYMWGGVVTWQRVIGTIGQPNFLAAYVLMSFFLGLALFLREYKNFGSWSEGVLPVGAFLFIPVIFLVMIYSLEAFDIIPWYGAFALMSGLALCFAFTYEKMPQLISDLIFGSALLLMYVCLLYTQSRGGYLGFFCGAVLFPLVVGRETIFRHWKKLAILVTLILAISAYTMTRPEYSPFERFTSEIETKVSADKAADEPVLEFKGAAGSRGETWKSGFKIIADNPLFGVGPEVLKMVFPRYETELFRFKETYQVKQDRAHNESLDVPLTKGIPALVVFLWILLVVYRSGWRKAAESEDEEKLLLGGLLAATLAYLIQNQFSFGVVAITSLCWMMWGLVMVLLRDRSTEAERALVWPDLAELPWLKIALILAVVFFLIHLSFFSFRADIGYKTGKTYLEMRRLPEAAEHLQNSLAVLPLEGTTISHLGIVYLNMGRFDDAVRFLEYGSRVDPYNADNFFMLARVSSGERARAYAELTLKIDPYYSGAYDLLGQIYEKEGKLPEAWKMYARAFEINPTIVEVLRRLEKASERLGKKAELKALIAKARIYEPDNLELYKAEENLK